MHVAAEAAPAASEASSTGHAAPGRLATLPEHFVGLDDVVVREIADLEYPWRLQEIEERIQEYIGFSENINAQLSARVMHNYNEFVQGMQQVQAVETELTLINVLVKNGRRKLQERDAALLRGGMAITRQHRKSERLKRLLSVLADFQGVVQINAKLQQCLDTDNYCEAIRQHSALGETLATERFQQFPGLVGLREGLKLNLVVVQQKLSDGLRVAAVSSEFDAERYEDILRAYSMMSPDQALSVGKELLRHVSECIVNVSRQCMLAFSAAPNHESTSDWHRKAQLKDLCRSMDPARFVACIAQLYEHLWDFLHRHRMLCAWHATREKSAEGAGDAGFREVLRSVLTEHTASKSNVWDRIQQQVSLVLMTLDFQYPALNEDSFMHILHLTQVLIEEGDAFIAGHQGPRGQGSAGEGRRQFSAPIRGTLKSKANDYFQSLHFNAWVSFKMAYIEQDSWQRLPVPRSHSLIRTERLAAMQLRPAERGSGGERTGSKPRTAESNPFRNYKPEPLVPLTVDPARAEGGSAGADKDLHEGAEEPDEHALLRHWIDDSESLPHEQIGSSMLSNSNRSPVVSTSTTELARLLEQHFRMMAAIPQLALDVFQSAVQLIEFYMHCILRLFVQDRHLRVLLDDLEAQPAAADGKLQSRHEAFLLQRLCPDLRRAMVRTRDFMSALSLPESCAANLNMQPPVTGAVFLQVMPFPKLTSPSSLCGLSERCVGVESVRALLGDLRERRQWLLSMLPRGAEEAVDRFYEHQETVATQLRTFVLSCAARDILEVPDVGRVSLDHFSSTVQALRWEAKEFPHGSPAIPYLEQLRNQIDELARRIPCAGGGSIPHATQQTVWGWVGVRFLHECTEVVAKCGRKKSQEALCCMAQDFQSVRMALQENQNFKSASGAEEMPLLPIDHPLAATVQWSYLDQYLEAHGYLPNEAQIWCTRHPEYPLRLHRALLEYLHGGNQKALRQHQTDFESFLAKYIADESAGF